MQTIKKSIGKYTCSISSTNIPSKEAAERCREVVSRIVRNK